MVILRPGTRRAAARISSFANLADTAPARAFGRSFRRSSARRWDACFVQRGSRLRVSCSLSLSFVSSLWHSAAASYGSSLAPAAPVISKRVAPGDTLWGYAARYGDPNSYILDRVETIARDNHLSSNVPLVPGQILRIAVRNPVCPRSN